MSDEKKAVEDAEVGKPVRLPCGCAYQDKGWILMRLTECEYHKRKRTTTRSFRPKAECVRP